MYSVEIVSPLPFKQSQTLLPLSSPDSCLPTVRGQRHHIHCSRSNGKASCSLRNSRELLSGQGGEFLLALDREGELNEGTDVSNDKEAQLKLSRCNVCMK